MVNDLELTAIYPGTFDPLTRGHEDLIKRASKLFSKVIVAVAVAHHKSTLFTCDERIAMAKDVLSAHKNVEVHGFAGLLKNFVEEHNACIIIRGLRAVSDFDYEFQMAGMNQSLMPKVETIFLPPSQQYHFVSATFVREIGLLGGDISNFVSPQVLKALQAKRAKVALKKTCE